MPLLLIMSGCLTVTDGDANASAAPVAPVALSSPAGAMQLGGLGIVLQDRAGQLVVTRVLAHSPACTSGLHGGDVLVAVDGTRTATLAFDGVLAQLRGPRGSTVAVVVERPGATAPIAVTLERDYIAAATDDTDCASASQR